MGIPNPFATVFYVDLDSGRDSYNGRSPRRPFQTIQAAIDAALSGRGDYIFVLNAYQADTYPIVVNKARLHIIGVSNPNGQAPYLIPIVDTAAISLEVAGAGSEIAGFTLGGGAAHGCIEMNGTGGFWIHHNLFGGANAGGTPQDGIRSKQGVVNAECLIEDNIFHGNLAQVPGKLTQYGFVGQGTNLLRHSIIRNNLFLGLAGGIFLGNAAGLSLLDNKFVCPDAADGEAITLNAGARGCMVDGNVGMNGGDAAMTKNPFCDLSGAGNNHWGVNWKSNTALLPQTS